MLVFGGLPLRNLQEDRLEREIITLFSLCAASKPCRSSSTTSPLEFFLSATRRLGTLSRRAAILSLRFVRYLFSIMLCAVFFTGGCRRGGAAFVDEELDDEPDEEDEEDFRFRWLLSFCVEVRVVGIGFEGMAMARSFDVSFGLSG